MRKIAEFHCIMPIANIASVLEHGILCHERAEQLPHRSVAMDEIQEIRDNKQIPGGLKLHQYANLYFHARNPMLSKRRAKAPELCVLQIDSKIGRLPSVVFTDGNASSDYARFLPYSQVRTLPFELIYAEDWRDEDHRTYYRKKFHKCAEILVPERIAAESIIGAYVVDEGAKASLAACGFSAEVVVDEHLFFR